MLTITSVLALFTLLALSTAIFFIAKRIRVPYTVLLVLVGILLIPIVQLPFLRDVFGFLDSMKLTPELLFFIFLPILIFESGFNMSIRKMLESAWSILTLSVLGLILSAGLIATALYFALPLVGIEIPFIMALLFGAIISSTDPVAVLALFKEYGAPKRLTMIFEGESLFNDGTAVALFLVILGIATGGFHGGETVLDGSLMFIGMVIFGIILGLLAAGAFSAALRFTRSNEFATVTLLIISAHLVFIIAELINANGIFGLHFHVSSIIATTVSSLFLGNYSRHMLSPKTDNYLGKFIEHIAFMANSLVFIMAGLLFASANVDVSTLWLPILVTVLIVMAVRAIVIFATVPPLNKLHVEAPIPKSWQLLLAWGSLRGALAIIIVLLIPADLQVEGWNYAQSPRDFILAITIGCILTTLFLKAPLIGTFIRKLKLDKPSGLQLAHDADLSMYYLRTEESRFEMHKTRGFVHDESYMQLKEDVAQKIANLEKERASLGKQYGEHIFEQSLHLTAIHIERNSLQQLYTNGEISERMYRKILGKLNLQTEKIEAAQHDDINPSHYSDRRDIFDRMVSRVHTIASFRPKEITIEEKLQYYRAQMIIARKAVKILSEMQNEFAQTVFLVKPYDKVIKRYTAYKDHSSEKVDNLLASHGEELSQYLGLLAEKALAASGTRALGYLHNRGIIDEQAEEAISHRWS